MAETVKVVDYFVTQVEDKPGEARRLLEHLSEKEVNLLVFSTSVIGGGVSLLEFVPENAALLKEAASDAGIALAGPEKAFLIQGEDRIGALYDHHLKLANANVNVYSACGISSGSGRYGYVVRVREEDLKPAAEALLGGETDGHYGTLRPGGLDW